MERKPSSSNSKVTADKLPVDIVEAFLLNLESASAKNDFRETAILCEKAVDLFGKYREEMVEAGVVQGILGVLERFSNRERVVEQGLRSLLELHDFVDLGGDKIAVCLVLRAKGVKTCVDILLKQLNRQSHKNKKSVHKFLFIGVILLRNIACVESGTRMLIGADAHRFLLMPFTSLKDSLISNKREREIWFHTIGTLSIMAMFQLNGRSIFHDITLQDTDDTNIGKNKADRSTNCNALILEAVMVNIHANDLSFHTELCRLLCFVSAGREGAKAILACEQALVYVFSILRSSTFSKPAPPPIKAPTPTKNGSGREAEDKSSNVVSPMGSTGSPTKKGGKEVRTGTSAHSSMIIEDKDRDKESLQSSINQSLNKGLGLGASFLNKLTRKPSLSRDEQEHADKEKDESDYDALIEKMKENEKKRSDSLSALSGSQGQNGTGPNDEINDPDNGTSEDVDLIGLNQEDIGEGEVETLSRTSTDSDSSYRGGDKKTPLADPVRAGTWAAMLVHNLCLGARLNPEKRKEIAEEYEKNLNFGSSHSCEIYFEVLERIVAICSFTETKDDSGSGEKNEIVCPADTKNIENLSAATKIIDYISRGVNDDIEGDLSGRIILFNLAYIEQRYGVKLDDMMEALVLSIDSELKNKPWLDQSFGRSSKSESSLPKALPASRQTTRLLTFVYTLAGHPSLRNRLIKCQNAIDIITKMKRYSLSGMDINNVTLRNVLLKGGALAPEYFNSHFDTLWALLDIEPLREKKTNKPVEALENERVCLRQTKLLGYRYFPASKIKNSHDDRDLKQSLKSPLKRSIDNRFSRLNNAGVADSTNDAISQGQSLPTPYVTSHSNSVLSPLLSSRSLITDEDNNADENKSKSTLLKDESGLLGESRTSISQESQSSSSLLFTDPDDMALLNLQKCLDNPKMFAEQVSLYQQRLYLAIDPCLIILCANEIEALVYFRFDEEIKNNEDTIEKNTADKSNKEPYSSRKRMRRHMTKPPQPSEATQAVKRFLDEYYKVVYVLKDSIIKGRTPQIRAEKIGLVIDIAEHAADDNLKNACLTMACLEALDSGPIRRLELSWRNVNRDKWNKFEWLKRLCEFDESAVLPHVLSDGYSSADINQTVPPSPSVSQAYEQRITPTPFFQSSRVPYLQGILRALHAISFSWVTSASVVNSYPVTDVIGDSEDEADGSISLKPLSSGNLGDLVNVKYNKRRSLSGDIQIQRVLGEDYMEKGLSSIGSTRSFNVSSVSSLTMSRSLSELAGSPKGSGIQYDPLGIFEKSSNISLQGRDTSSEGNANTDFFIGWNNEESGKQNQVGAGVTPISSMNTAQSLDVDAFELMKEQYSMLNLWISNIGPDGDWYPKVFVIQPEPSVHMYLKKVNVPSMEDEMRLLELSFHQEPMWSLDQMMLESMYAVEGLVESLFQNDMEKEAGMLKHIRTLSIDDTSKGVIQDPPTKASSSSRNIADIYASQLRNLGTSPSTKESKTISENNNTTKSQQKLSPKYVGKIINTIVKEISTNRRNQMLEESGVRSVDQWERIVDHVRLCVERIVLAPILSRLMLTTLRETTEQECALQEKIGILQKVPLDQLAPVLGIPKRSGLDKCLWYGAVATLKTLDVISMPSLKLGVLLGVKDEIFREANNLGVCDMNADDYLPVMTFIICRAGLRHPWSTVTILRQILGDDFVSGEAAYYLTTFEIALNHLLHLDIPSSIL